MGAEVIKVENPDAGDDTRRMTSPNIGGEAHFFLAFNRSKQSLTVDPRTEEGKEILLGLLADADVLVENYRPGVMKRFGLDYASVKDKFPRLIYLSVSAYGQTGPNGDRRGYDPIAQAESGMMAMTGDEDGPPTRMGVSLFDIMAGQYLAQGILAALVARDRPGMGQRIHLPLSASAPPTNQA